MNFLSILSLSLCWFRRSFSLLF
ncbi:MAG: GlyGly-CTERM sorting domain-containing protein [Alphaproteobacteria bacterium]|nr:GlyGly-CTERM sorting domain-containing protein [Alphaproteobacteria bacterium]